MPEKLDKLPGGIATIELTCLIGLGFPVDNILLREGIMSEQVDQIGLEVVFWSPSCHHKFDSLASQGWVLVEKIRLNDFNEYLVFLRKP